MVVEPLSTWRAERVAVLHLALGDLPLSITTTVSGPGVFLMLIALNSGAANDTPSSVDTHSLKLSIVIQKLCALGQKVPFALTLESTKDQRVPPLETAHLVYFLERYSPDKRSKVAHGHRLDDGVTAIVKKMPNGQDMTLWVKRKAPENTSLEKGKRLERRLVLQDVLGKFSETGDYLLTVTYQGAVHAEAAFSILLEYSESVPALIDLTEAGDFETRCWARNALWMITGQPSWRPAKDDDPQVVQARVRELRAWWRDNHELFERINRIFVPQKPTFPPPPADARPGTR